MPNKLNAGQRATDPAINSSTVATYVWAVIILAFMTIAGVVAVLLLRPNDDNGTIISVIVGTTAPIILAILALITRENHLAMNSRLDQLVAVTSQLAKSEGKAEGVAQNVAATAAALVPPEKVENPSHVLTHVPVPLSEPVPVPVPVVIIATEPIPVTVEDKKKPLS